MSPERFDYLLKLVEPLISRQETNFWKPITAGERLSITLRLIVNRNNPCHFHIVWKNLQYQMGQGIEEWTK